MRIRSKRVASGFTLLIVLSLFAAACGSDDEAADATAAAETTTTAEAAETTTTAAAAETTTKPPAQPSSSGEGDASSRLACSHFFNVANDATAGVLTVEELREKLKEVNDNAKVSEAPGIRESARAMLAAVTSDDGDGFLEAVEAMGDACRAAGS